MLNMVKGGGNGGDTTDADSLSSEDIEDLVSNIADASNSTKEHRDGGTVREKYTCKCCGTRVDSGVHKCDRCIEAGCEYGEENCKFH